jgi:hypothetical protein
MGKWLSEATGDRRPFAYQASALNPCELSDNGKEAEEYPKLVGEAGMCSSRRTPALFRDTCFTDTLPDILPKWWSRPVRPGDILDAIEGLYI